MHSDSGTALRNHRSNFRKRLKTHSLKEFSELRVRFKLLLIHVCEFRASRNEHRQNVLFFAFRVFPVVFNKTGHRHVHKELFEIFFVLSCSLCNLRERNWLSHVHLERNFCHFVGYDFVQSPVFRVIFVYFSPKPVRNLLTKLQNKWSDCFFFCHFFCTSKNCHFDFAQ